MKTWNSFICFSGAWNCQKVSTPVPLKPKWFQLKLHYKIKVFLTYSSASTEVQYFFLLRFLNNLLICYLKHVYLKLLINWENKEQRSVARQNLSWNSRFKNQFRFWEFIKVIILYIKKKLWFQKILWNITSPWKE